MKKLLFVFFVLFILFAPFILSEVSDSLEQNVEKAQDIKDTIEKSQDTEYWEEKWDYLGNEWKAIFLKNPVVSSFDYFFTKISFVFEVLFGVSYSLSFVLLGIVILWIFVFFSLVPLASATGFFSGNISYLVSLVLCIILAQFKTFEIIVLLLGRMAFSPEYVWTRLIVLFVIFISFALLAYLDRKLSRYIRLNRKLAREKNAEISQKAVTSFAENLLSFSKLGDKK